MTKTRKSTKTVGSKIILYTVLALIVFIVIGTASDRQMVSEASAITSTTVPSGVYALRNVRTGYYLDVSSYEEGTYVLVNDLGHVPSSAAERAYMFRIEQIGTTGRYAIRTMSNNYNSIMPLTSSKGSNLKSTEVARLNSQIESSKTWNITRTTNGYTLKPYGSSYYMTQYAETGILAKMLAYSTYGTLSEWELIPISLSFSSVGYYGGASSVQRDVAVGEQETVRAYFYSTNLNHTHITMSLRSADSSMASYTYDLASHSMTVTPSEMGMIRHQISIVNSSTNGKTTYVCEYVNIHLADGVYTFQNNYSGKYISCAYPTDGGYVFKEEHSSIPDSEDTRKSMLKLKYYPKDGNVAESGVYEMRLMSANNVVVRSGTAYSSLFCIFYNAGTTVLEEHKWKIEKTNDGYYQIIRNFSTDTESMTIASKEYDRDVAERSGAVGVEDDDFWYMESISTAQERAKWVVTKYTGEDFVGVENLSYGNYIIDGSDTTTITENISHLFDDLAFYSTVVDHNYCTVMGYSVFTLDGENTSIASIDTQGNITVQPNKAGMIVVNAIVDVSYSNSTAVASYGNSTLDVELNEERRVYIAPPNNNFVFIVNSNSYPQGYYTDVNGMVMSQEFSYSTSQLWQLIPSFLDFYYVKNVETGLYLTSSSSTTSGNIVTLQNLDSALQYRQSWKFDSEGLDYKIMSYSMIASECYLSVDDNNEIIQNNPEDTILEVLFNHDIIRLGNDVIIYGADTYDIPSSQDYVAMRAIKGISGLQTAPYYTYGIHTFVNGNCQVAASLMDEAKIYIHMAHGKETGQYANKRGLDGLSIDDFPDDLSNIDLVIFTGCSTAKETSDTNMIEAAVGNGKFENRDKAAKVAIGFKTEVYDVIRSDEQNYDSYFYEFYEMFFNKLVQTNSVERAIEYIESLDLHGFQSIEVAYKYGLEDYSFTP